MTGFSPGMLLFNRLIKTKLLLVLFNADLEKDSVTQNRDKEAKDKMKDNVDHG